MGLADTTTTMRAVPMRRPARVYLRPLSWLGRARASLVATGELLRDLIGLVDFLDLLNLAGKNLLRVNVKAITLVLLIYLGVNELSNALLGREAIDGAAVKSVTLAYAGVAVFAGVFLVLTSVVVKGSRLSAAQAYLLNLTEVRKRSEYGPLAARLWIEVFQEEARMSLPLAERRAREVEVRAVLRAISAEAYQGEEPVPGAPRGGATMDAREVAALRRIHDRGLFFTRLGFLYVTERLLRHPIPPHLYRKCSGLDFARVADYFDGGYFDVTDDRLAQQFAASRVLMEARSATRLPWPVRLRYSVGGGIRRMWFLLVSRAFAIQIAKLVDRLNQRLQPLPRATGSVLDGSFFCALHLLWPTRESEAEIADVFGPAGSAAVAACRRKLVASVFGRRGASARRVIDRMFVPNYLHAYEIRKRFDPDFLARLLRTGLHELRFLGLSERRLQAEWRDVSERQHGLEGFSRLLEREGQSDLVRDSEARRAVQVGFLTNRLNLASIAYRVAELERAEPGVSGDVAAERAALRSACTAVAREQERVTRAVRELRIHHLLCREQILQYRCQLNDLLAQVPGRLI